MIRPSHGHMVEAIIRTYESTSQEQRDAGCRWYPDARSIVLAIATDTRLDPHRVAHAMAALSPRNPWAWNVADTHAFAVAAAAGEEMPTGATTFGANARAAWRALTQDGAPWASAAPKVRSFVAAIMGDEFAVVVDTWAMRVVTNGAESIPSTANRYWSVADAYLEAALILGVMPRDLQAITWVAAQSAGLGSKRRARHDLTCKRGTPAFLRHMLRIA